MRLLKKRIVVGLLALIMAVSSLQYSTYEVYAEEATEETLEAGSIEEGTFGNSEEEKLDIYTIEEELEGVYQFGDAPSGETSESAGEPMAMALENEAEAVNGMSIDEYIYQEALKRNTAIGISEYGITVDYIGGIISGLLNEHPDLYFIEKKWSYSYSPGSKIATTIKFTYVEGLDDNTFKRETNKALSLIDKDMSDLQKAIILHDYLAVNCEYDYENYLKKDIPAMSYTAYGVFVNRAAVCQGYALAYKYLLNQAGIKCYMVTSDLMNHAWNLIVLDGEYYQVDVTWDDPTWDLIGRACHTYMFLSDEAFAAAGTGEKHHDWEVTSGSEVVGYEAVDKTYDDAFWAGVRSPLILTGDSWDDCYYAYYDAAAISGKINKTSLSAINNVGTALCDIGRWTVLNSTSYYSNTYSGLFLYNNRLYFNDKLSINSIALDGTDKKVEFTPDTTEGYIYGSALCQGKVLYSLHPNPNLSERETVLEADIEIEIETEEPSVIPVERIELNADILTLKLGETAELEATVTPADATDPTVTWDSSDSSVAKVEDGTVTAISVGNCTITASAGNKEAVCSVTVTAAEDDGNIASGIYEDISWTIDKDGKLTVEGTGEFSDSTEDNRAPWYEYRAYIEYAEIHVTGMTDASYMFFDCRYLKEIDLSGLDTGNVTDMSNMFNGCSRLTKIDLRGLDTKNVTDMSWMFGGCGSLTEIDFSDFDAQNVNSIYGMFQGCEQLEIIYTPYNLKESVALSGVWYKADGTEISELPQNLDYSILIMKGQTPPSITVSYIKVTKIKTVYDCGDTLNVDDLTVMYFDADGSIRKVDSHDYVTDADKIDMSTPGTKILTVTYNGCTAEVELTVNERTIPKEKEKTEITGITMTDSTYTGKPVVYAGKAVVKLQDGTDITDKVTLTYRYSGVQADNSPYTETGTAPVNAGDYVLTVAVSSDDEIYTGSSQYAFKITQAPVEITASDITFYIGDPAEITYKYQVKGLLNGDELIKEPLFACNVDTTKAGSYDIIPYGADAGNNYRINYINGILTVVDVSDNPGEDTEWGDVLLEDIPKDGVIPEGLWVAGITEDGYAYTGSAIKPEIRVYDYKTLLKEKTDYTIAYKNNTKANDASVESKVPTITVTGKGNYSGKDTKTFKILAPDISEGSADGLFEADDITVVYSSKAQKPVPVLLWNGKNLKNKTDYTYTYHKGAYEGSDTEEIASVKEAGSYYIKLTGIGNFTGTRRIKLTVLPDNTSLKPISKATVEKIANQSYQTQYKVGGITPEVTVKYGSEILTPGTHYTVSYSNNTEVGTAYAVIKGIEENGYSGTKRVSFKITGIAVKKATVKGLSGQTFIYSGVDIEPTLTLSVKVNGQERIMIPGTDYKVAWQNNRNAGTATAVITGLGGYTGTVKKTFKIKAFNVAENTGGRFAAVLENDTVPYAKGGAKPALKVTFTNEDGTVQTLTEGKDYTLTFKNNTAVNNGSNADKMPTVTIKGKGCFSGTYDTKLTYRIVAQDIGSLTLSAADKTYQNKKNIYATKVTITDLNGKTLKAGTDYDKAFTYVYKSDTTLADGTVRVAGTTVDKNDIIPAGTAIEVEVSSTGNYSGTIKGEYRITQSSISGASVSIPKQTYTGQAVTLSKEQITVKVKGKQLEPDQYEIVPGSYKNNVKKGTASVTIKGIGNYGGTKTVKFKIGTKGFSWWQKN